MPDPLDDDNPLVRATLTRLSIAIAGTLDAAGRDLGVARVSAWQAAALFGRLDRLRADADYLRREVARLVPPAGE